MIKKILSLFYSLHFIIFGILFLAASSNTLGQNAVTRIHTDWKGYWTANGATTGTNRPDLENNLIGFEWNGTTYSTGVDDVTLTNKVPSASIQKFRALKIQSLSYTGSTYFLQGAMIDGSATGRALNPLLGGSTSTPAELASRLTDGINGLALGTGIANIPSNSVYFKVGTGNLNLLGLNDGVPDLIVTQVAEPGGTPDVFRFVDASGNLVGNAISINFGGVSKVGSYSLDLFNASNGAIANSFVAQETRDIRILGYDTSAFGINAANAAQVDRFEVRFSGNSDCAFIAFNANSLKKAELSLVKTGVISGCGIAGDVINYTFVVTNTGDVPITSVTVTDPLTGLTISGTQGSTLAVGATVTLTGTYTITASDVTAGKVTNQAKVTGFDPSLNTVEDLSGQANGNNVATVTNLLSAPTGITGTATICNGASTTLSVSGGSLAGTGASIEWFAGTCGGTPIGTGTSITVSPTSNTTYYVRYSGSCNTTGCASQVVTVNSLPNNITDGFVASKMCAGDSPQLTYDAEDTTFTSTVTSPYSITYKNNATLVQYTITIPSASPFSFTPGDNPTANTGYTLLSISNATCTNSDVNSFLDSGANLIIRPIPTATISGTTSVCVGDSSPNITFSNPQTVTIKVTYTINSGLDQTIIIPPKIGLVNGTNSATVSTVAGGSFVYSLKSVVYNDTPACSNTITGTATVTVNPTPTVSTAAQTIFACDNSKATIKLTGLLPNTASTISYTIAGDTPQTVSVTADVSGIGYFDTRVLTVLPDNGKTLQITAVNTASCSTTGLAINVTLTVQPNSGSIKLEGNAISGSTTFSELSTAHFSIDPIAGATGYSWTFPPTWNVTAGAGTNAITVTTGAYNDSDITVLVTASNSFCPTAVTVALSAIPPPAPVPSAIVAVSCNLLGSVTFNNLPAESWTLTTIKGSVSTVSTGSGNTSTVSNLTAGDYTFRITTARGSAVSGLVTVPDMPITTWTGGTTWSNGLPNDPAKKIILDAIGTPSGFMEGCSCTVKATANITIGSGQVLKLQNELNVETGGTLTFLNGASLVQKNDVTNSGIIHYNRTTSAVQDFDYVYWSSPVAGQTLGALSPSSDKYWSWDVDNWVKAEAGDVMAKGQGYIARVPRYISAQNVEFVGVPFNGPVTVPSKGDTKGNLVGNPYPCAVDAVKFLDTNGNFMSTETLYFWTHVGNRTLNGAGTQYVYSSNDYASFNRTGGLKAVNGGEKPNGTIAAGQSVFVIGKGTGDLVFTNSMRLDAFNAVNDNSQFFKQSNTKKAQKIERNRVWLNLTNEGGAFKQLLVGYITGASNGFDKSFDGPTFNGNTFVDFYSINDSKNYAIQGRGLPFDPADEVPLGYKTTIAGTFQIGIDEVDGGMVNQEIYLEDKTTNTIHDLTKGSYSFTTAIGEFKDRFVLRYTDTSKLGTGDFDPKGKGVIVSVNNSQIKINSFDKTISSVKVYDLKGSLLYEKSKVDKNEFVIDHFASSTQFMIVMVQLEDGNWVSEEIIFHD